MGDGRRESPHTRYDGEKRREEERRRKQQTCERE